VCDVAVMERRVFCSVVTRWLGVCSGKRLKRL
jgi:hypothetical protein